MKLSKTDVCAACEETTDAHCDHCDECPDEHAGWCCTEAGECELPRIPHPDECYYCGTLSPDAACPQRNFENPCVPRSSLRDNS